MGVVADQFNIAFRDFNTDGVPSSGDHEVVKSDARAIGPVIEQFLATQGIASTIYPTTAAGITATSSGQLFLVKGDGTTSFADLYLNSSGTAVSQNVSLPSTAGIGSTIDDAIKDLPRAFSFGDFIDRLLPFGSEADNGASLVGNFGVSVPSGSTGQGSFIRPRWVADFSENAGDVAVVKVEVTHSSTFTRVLQAVFQVSTASNVFVTRMDEPGTFVSSETDGNRTIYTFRYVMQGDEIALMPYVIVNASPNAASPETFEITGLSFAFLETEDAFRNSAEKTIELLKGNVLDEAADLFQSSTGNLVNQLADFGSSVANGGAISDKFAVTVAPGSTGAGSFIRTRWQRNLAEYVGAQIELKLRVSTSAPFTRTLVPTFQLSTAANPFVVRTPDLETKVVGTEIVYIYRYTVQGDEIALNPYVAINPGQTTVATVAETFTLTGFAASLATSTDPFDTPADYNTDLVKHAVVEEAYKLTILRPTFAETITVGASGANFTTLSDAVAAIAGSSVRKQYKIAWSASALLGMPNFHIPAFTALVCQDRTDDAILSFANPNDASADAITNTSLAWIDADGVVIDGGTWQITNGRYVFHWETNGNFPDTRQSLLNVVAQHMGNASAVNNAWGIASQVAVGIGMSGGQVVDIENCRLSGPGGGLLAHSPANVAWTDPFEVNLKRTRLEGTNASYPDLVIKPIHVGPGRATLSQCSFDALSYTDAEWIGGNPGTGVNTAQIQVTLAGNANLLGTGTPSFNNNITFGAPAGASYSAMKVGI